MLKWLPAVDVYYLQALKIKVEVELIFFFLRIGIEPMNHAKRLDPNLVAQACLKGVIDPLGAIPKKKIVTPIVTPRVDRDCDSLIRYKSSEWC
jgi:hypothetical protein